MSPLALVAGRSVLGCGVMALVLAARGKSPAGSVRAGDSQRILLLAILGVVLQGWIQAHALTMTSAIHSGWLITLIPIFTAVLSAAFLGERFPALKLSGVILGLCGALLVVAGAHGVPLRAPATRGDLLILLSALNWSIYTLVARSLFVRRDPLVVTAKSLAVGAAILVTCWLVFGNVGELSRVTSEGLWALAFLGIGCTGIAYVCWSLALARFEPGSLTSFQYLQPLVTLAAASAWLDEPIVASAFGGALLALLGVFLVQRGSAPADRPQSVG
jgi:drug/metabolite transporter (DMT)-like permease